MNESARKILSDAWDTVERVDKMLKNMDEREPYVPLPQHAPIVRRVRGLDTMPLPEMDKAETDAAWNRWVDAKIIQHCDVYADELCAIVFTRMNDKIVKVKDAAHAEIEQLKAQVAELRGEMNLLRALLQGGNVKEIRSGHLVELRKPDVA